MTMRPLRCGPGEDGPDAELHPIKAEQRVPLAEDRYLRAVEVLWRAAVLLYRRI